MSVIFPEHNEKVRAMMTKLSEVMPTSMASFLRLHKATMSDGALSMKVKELVALAIAVTVRCDGCVAFHVNDALKAGASRREILETIGVAIMMGGGPSVVYGTEALQALDQFEAVGTT